MDFRIHRTLSEIRATDWNAISPRSFPFADYEFLIALERSKSVGAQTAWSPFYLTAWQDERLVAATFVYRKTDSWGEFIFDHQWAYAYAQYGVRYFPKLVVAVPFTPATGDRILVHPSLAEDKAQKVRLELIEGTKALMQELKCSSAHFLFIPPESVALFEQAHMMVRHSYQYHWHNRGYETFDDFLEALKQKRRKEVIRERKSVVQSDLDIQMLTGDAITQTHCDVMFDLYCLTNEKHGSEPSLTQEFYKEVFQTMKDRIVIFMAFKRGKPLAGALNFKKGQHMYGRYWGAFEEIKNLHFELCYYRPIEYAINNGLSLYEAGAQGTHKIPRGFVPTVTLSAHAIAHPAFRDAIGQFIGEEKQAIREWFAQNAEHLPYRDAAEM